MTPDPDKLQPVTPEIHKEFIDAQAQHAEARKEFLRDVVKHEQIKNREEFKLDPVVVLDTKLEKIIHPNLKASALAYMKEIEQSFEEKFKGKTHNTEVYAKLVIYELKMPIITIANRYQKLIENTNDEMEKLKLVSEFNEKAKERTGITKDFLRSSVGKEGYIDVETLVKISSESFKVAQLMALPANEDLKEAAKYAFELGKGMDRIKFLAIAKENLIAQYPNGELVKIVWFLVGKMKPAERISLAKELKQHPKFQPFEDFLMAGNKEGVFTLMEMETIRGAKYAEDLRQEISDRWKAKHNFKEKVVNVRGPYGSRNVWDDVDMASIGLFVADSAAMLTFAANGIVSIKNPSSWLTNEYMWGSGAWLGMRHLIESEEPAKLRLAEKKTREGIRDEMAVAALESEYGNLSFEQWNGWLTIDKDQGIRVFRQFLAVLKEKNGKQLPKEITATQFEAFLLTNHDPSMKALYAEVLKRFKQMDASSRAPGVIQNFARFIDYYGEHGVTNANTYDQAIKSIHGNS